MNDDSFKAFSIGLKILSRFFMRILYNIEGAINFGDKKIEKRKEA